MKHVYFTKKGKLAEAAHAFVEKEYMARRILAKGKMIPQADEYVIVFDLKTSEIAGVLGIIENNNGRLPFQESFSGVNCGENAIELGRFVIKRMIALDEKIKIGRKLFDAAVNWYVLHSKIQNKTIECYLETHDYIIDFFNKALNKNIFYHIKEAVFKTNSLLSQNSMGFLEKAQIYKINTVNALCPENDIRLESHDPRVRKQMVSGLEA